MDSFSYYFSLYTIPVMLLSFLIVTRLYLKASKERMEWRDRYMNVKADEELEAQLGSLVSTGVDDIALNFGRTLFRLRNALELMMPDSRDINHYPRNADKFMENICLLNAIKNHSALKRYLEGENNG